MTPYERILSTIRRSKNLALWLANRVANSEIKKLHASYDPKIADAVKAKDWKKRNELQEEMHWEMQQINDSIAGMRSERLATKARKYGISVPRQNDESEDWYISSASGDWILNYETSLRIGGAIRAEKRARFDEFRKWTTLGFAFAGFTLGLLSILKNSKPDPCPVNYYRGDTGACIFALDRQSGNGKSPETISPLTISPKSNETSFVPH